MIIDQQTGRSKKAIPGKCLICNGEETLYISFGMKFCQECFVIMNDEEKMSERIVWDE